VSKTTDLGGKVGRIFSHKSLEELNSEPSNKTPAWSGNKLFGWEVTKILHRTGLNSTRKLTNHHNNYTCAHFQKRLCKYLGLDTLLLAAQEHEALYPVGDTMAARTPTRTPWKPPPGRAQPRTRRLRDPRPQARNHPGTLFAAYAKVVAG
jgi:hypothetical protein